ncbi:hypothetical protein DSO57_1007254 [Entomophthora muscae]|uniref:Uncharacterized protein n=1 Tax=Entomophthora muscae TaxID=34485 RepID=A0ACC2UGH2_9FUNG|nr:hypothetical protein DSO57_1007254 [Entomophthora muscae]
MESEEDKDPINKKKRKASFKSFPEPSPEPSPKPSPGEHEDDEQHEYFPGFQHALPGPWCHNCAVLAELHSEKYLEDG